MKRKDKRMNHTTEAVQNIKTLKLYSWTGIFEREINNRREREIKIFKRVAVMLSTLIAGLYFFPNILIPVCFSTHIGTGHYISLADAFAMMIFFELLKEPII